MEEAEIRMEIYMTLATAFTRPNPYFFSLKNEQALARILGTRTKRYLLSVYHQPTLKLLSFIHRNAENIGNKFWQDFTIEYNRLFVGPFAPKAPPNESRYWNPYHQKIFECLLRISEAYTRENLILKQEFHDLPDHIVAELEFMAFLCEKELNARLNNKTEKTLSYLLKQYDFLVNHLSKWCSEFSKEIESNTDCVFYLSLAALLRDFISDDLEKLRDEIYKLEVKVQNSPAHSKHEKNSRLPLYKKIKRQEAEYSIEVNSADCILCGVCVSCCPTKAFRMDNTQRRIQLLFKAALCTGCEQCSALCPQQAIKLSAGFEEK
ncbi:MAG: molecular chaperone TorD family protein, partial [bacterium]